MAHKRIGKENPVSTQEKKFAKDVPMKPLVRQYLKEYPTEELSEHAVIGGRLTTNGWFLFETEKFVFMLPGGSQDAQHLFQEIFPSLDGKVKKQLLVIPYKGDKFGAYLAVDSEKTTEYVWDENNYTLYVGKQTKKKESIAPLSVADFE